MNRITVFNPEHDMALANGDRYFIAPRNIREMARDLAPLLDIVSGDGITVWGWDHAIKTHLRRMGIDAAMLPTDAALTALRTCSERKAAHHLLRAFHADHPHGPYTGESLIAHNIEDIASYATRHGHIILKDPLSSSGKGLRHVNMNEEGLPLPPSQPKVDARRGRSQRGGTEGTPSLSSSLSKVENWANALIKRHGYLTAEPFYDKVQDFAMEFCVREGQCHFIGYSLFSTNHHGRYESNLLMADERIEAQLARYVPSPALHAVRDWVIAHHHTIIPAEWDTTRHPLYFGIDMMVVNFQFSTLKVCASEQESSLLELFQRAQPKLNNAVVNSQFRIHPCVEINLRLNMGIIAHEVRRKLLAPGTEGTFYVTAFSTGEAAQQFHQEHTTKYPPVYREGKMVSGYHPLTPIHSHTRHHAYVICG